MYNGFDARKWISKARTNVRSTLPVMGIIGRGVCIDIPKIRQVEWIEPGDAIYPEDLDAAERAIKTKSVKAT